jgi:hypothetical protein
MLRQKQGTGATDEEPVGEQPAEDEP